MSSGSDYEDDDEDYEDDEPGDDTAEGEGEDEGVTQGSGAKLEEHASVPRTVVEAEAAAAAAAAAGPSAVVAAAAAVAAAEAAAEEDEEDEDQGIGGGAGGDRGPASPAPSSSDEGDAPGRQPSAAVPPSEGSAPLGGASAAVRPGMERLLVLLRYASTRGLSLMQWFAPPEGWTDTALSGGVGLWLTAQQFEQRLTGLCVGLSAGLSEHDLQAHEVEEALSSESIDCAIAAAGRGAQSDNSGTARIDMRVLLAMLGPTANGGSGGGGGGGGGCSAGAEQQPPHAHTEDPHQHLPRRSPSATTPGARAAQIRLSRATASTVAVDAGMPAPASVSGPRWPTSTAFPRAIRGEATESIVAAVRRIVRQGDLLQRLRQEAGLSDDGGGITEVSGARLLASLEAVGLRLSAAQLALLVRSIEETPQGSPTPMTVGAGRLRTFVLKLKLARRTRMPDEVR